MAEIEQRECQEGATRPRLDSPVHPGGRMVGLGRPLDPRPRLGARRVAAALAACAVVTVVQVRYSERAWRLSQDLVYDDITYVDDAGQRLETWFRDGLGPMVVHLWMTPPVSPYQTALGMLGFLAFGLNDAAPYVANALLLAVVSLLLLFAWRDQAGWVAGLAVAFFLTSALAARSVVEFRPDLANGIFTAAFVFFLARGVLFERPGEIRLSGLLFGVALLTKPNFFAHTLVIGAWTGLLLLAVAIARRRSRPIPWREVGWALLIAVLVAAPYYVRNGRAVFDYFWTNTRSTALFLFDPTLSRGAVAYRYVLARYHGFGIIGWQAPVSWALCAGAVLVSGRRRRWDELLLIGTAASTALLSLAIVTAGRLDNPFFAATFHALLLLAGLQGAVILLHEVPLRRRALAGWVAGAAVVGLAILNAWPQRWSGPPDVAHGTSWNDAIVRAIRDDARRRGLPPQGSRPITVFLTAVGDVSAHSLEWTALKAQLSLVADQEFRGEDPAAIALRAMEADYVVVPDAERAAVVRAVRAPTFGPELVRRFRADPALQPVASGVAGDPDRYLVFANLERLDGKAAQATFGNDRLGRFEGFLPEEGPYPQWDLGRVRWVVEPRARFCVTRAAKGDRVELSAAIRSGVDGTLHVDVAGAQVASTALRTSADDRLRFAFVAQDAGPCVDLDVEGRGKDVRLVLFKAVRVAINGR